MTDHRQKAEEAKFEKLRTDMAEVLRVRHGIEAPELTVVINDKDADYVSIIWRQYGLEMILNLLRKANAFPGGLPINRGQINYYADCLVSDMVSLKKELGVVEFNDKLEEDEQP